MSLCGSAGHVDPGKLENQPRPPDGKSPVLPWTDVKAKRSEKTRKSWTVLPNSIPGEKPTAPFLADLGSWFCCSRVVTSCRLLDVRPHVDSPEHAGLVTRSDRIRSLEQNALAHRGANRKRRHVYRRTAI